MPRKEQLHRFQRSRCQGLGINRLQQECNWGDVTPTVSESPRGLGAEQKMGCSPGTWLSPPIPPPSCAPSPRRPAPPLFPQGNAFPVEREDVPDAGSFSARISKNKISGQAKKKKKHHQTKKALFFFFHSFNEKLLPFPWEDTTLAASVPASRPGVRGGSSAAPGPPPGPGGGPASPPHPPRRTGRRHSDSDLTRGWASGPVA